MRQHTYYVKGMHCASCEILIEKELLSLPGVTFAYASLSKGLVNIEYEKEKPSLEKLNARLKARGYTFAETPFKSEKTNGLWKVLIGASLTIAAFLFITKSGFSSVINISSGSSLPAFFIFGLLAGVSSCAALIGGLLLSLSKQWVEDYGQGGGLFTKARPYLLFNFGRLISLSLLGLLLGFLGEKFKISQGLTSIMVLLVSAVMLGLALQMLGVKAFNRFRFTLPKSFGARLFKDRGSTAAESFVVGFLTFLLPCGFTVVAEGLAVLSGSPLRGLSIMLLFALGTSLPLLAIGFSSAKFLSNQRLSEKFLKVAGLLIIFFVSYNLNFQFGIARFVSEKLKSETSVEEPLGAIPAADAQIIQAIYTSSYDIQPNTFEVKTGQPVRFEVAVEDNSYGCMSTIMVPKLWNRPLVLEKGKILVMEFTPEKAGTYQITCAMGVPRGILKVVN